MKGKKLIKKFRFLKWGLVLLALAYSFSCQPRAKFPEADPAQVTHKVSYQGETLAIISKWYTGSAKNWERVLENNPGLDVYKIDIGDQIIIPGYLVIRSEKMPKSYIRKSLPKTRPDSQVLEEKQEGDSSSTETSSSSEESVVPSNTDSQVEKETAINEADAIPEAGEVESKTGGEEKQEPPNEPNESELTEEELRIFEEKGLPDSAASSSAVGDIAPESASSSSKSRDDYLRELLSGK